MPSATPPPTFRDPAGFLSLTPDHAVRTIHGAARDSVMSFLSSPLRQRLEQRGEMVSTVIADDSDGDSLKLRHPRIPVITYPWEWTQGQWMAAGELTLGLCEEALEQGWILKDATPLNILFTGTGPVLVDVLSFEKHVPGNSIWLAYGQYVRTFLLPMLMNRLQHWPLALTLFRRDGYEPAELYDALSWPQRLSPAAFFPITLPSWLERRSSGASAKSAVAPAKEPALAHHLLRRTLKGLRRRTRNAPVKQVRSEWSDYTATLTHYTEQESQEKVSFVRETLETLKPARVLDIGANTGEFSALAASVGASVVALERDEAAAERLFQRARAQQLDILAIHADLARPTPAVGWENSESSSLLARLEGQFDLVLMLAVVHHLLLMEQIPLDAIMELLGRLTRRYLLLEWVPASDPMFQSLMRGRDELYGSLCEDDLVRACQGRFTLLQRQSLPNGRVLLLLEKQQPGTSAA
ncbi:methyltransferase domain-containing protein [Granulicella sp. 5B5]|uniref:class I SAM-dependent methyltransferase n=1 Tax=Granulicella sp. 5B5 TaxID=1617967 RepID=UPI0015F77930|nr:class I SAM-dependent methyltransferase [Granulicella sp. 5B5]QMV18950.1 methyltransferase domain-containing protein [Granulicella sp. 5B5]